MKRFLVFLITGFTSIALSTSAFAQNSSYAYNIDKFERGLASGKNSLLFYLESAHLSNPTAEEPIELIKKISGMDIYYSVANGYQRSALYALEQKNYNTARFYFSVIQYFEENKEYASQYLAEIDKAQKDESYIIKTIIRDETKEIEPEVLPKAFISDMMKTMDRPSITVQQSPWLSPKAIENHYYDERSTESTVNEENISEQLYDDDNPRVEYFKNYGKSDKTTLVYDLSDKQIENDVELLIKMDDDLWARQPNTEIEIEVGKSIILEGRAIQRFLVITQGYVNIERVGSNELRVQSLKRGSTFVHIWDQRGRWTFNLTGITPVRRILKQSKDIEQLRENYYENFKISQSTNWNGFYLGNSLDELERQSLVFRNWIGLYGPTPYGDFDASTTYNKFAESTERIEQTVGLTNANVGQLKNFNVRFWDSSKRFSDLTLPGRYFRGFLFDKTAYDGDLKWSYIRGKDRSSASAVTPDSTDFRESWIEGGRVTLYPENPDKNYSFNFARGWGEAREQGLKHRVYSVETNQRYKEWKLYSELAYDEDEFALNLAAKLDRDKEKWRIYFRNIDENYRTITGRSGDNGEIGTIVRYDKRLEGLEYGADLDLYKDRDQENFENENYLNVDLSGYMNYDIDENWKLRSNLYVLNTPQLISPSTNFRLNNTLSRTFHYMENRHLTAFIGHTVQTNRYSLSETSEFNRNSIRTGFRMPLIRNMNYYLTYEQAWVENKFTNNRSTPSLTETGVSYSRYLGKKISSNMSVNYRNEQDTEGDYSFLSGTDDIRTSLGLSYRPKNDMEIFLDGTYRNVWTEANDEGAHTEMDVRIGMRTTWDMMFGWNPTGTIGGVVWNDSNDNGVFDRDEHGVANVRVKVGKQTITTNENGFYAALVNAESAIVEIDSESLPQGFLVSTGTLTEVKVKHRQDAVLDFGLVSQTAFYGLVFVDDNNNSRLDQGEQTVAGVKINLDNDSRKSGYNGSFRFNAVEPGNHEVNIDIKSIPVEFLPKIKLKDTVFIQEGVGLEYLIPLKKK